ncbi:MAG: hypothetical protein HOM11_00560 [Methylococcales bacterium]|jgi:hypothetical protein|nr:hypothetical protein [Methylococcales bacterium]MBT7444704.1 hypothetical protein [Methylococcales bacterium]
MAIGSNGVLAVKRLVLTGANVNADLTSDDMTALTYAPQLSHREIEALLTKPMQ